MFVTKFINGPLEDSVRVVRTMFNVVQVHDRPDGRLGSMIVRLYRPSSIRHI